MSFKANGSPTDLKEPLADIWDICDIPTPKVFYLHSNNKSTIKTNGSSVYVKEPLADRVIPIQINYTSNIKINRQRP